MKLSVLIAEREKICMLLSAYYDMIRKLRKCIFTGIQIETKANFTYCDTVVEFDNVCKSSFQHIYLRLRHTESQKVPIVKPGKT